MDIINKRTDELKPYELNAKLHDERQIENVAESIRKFGWKQPLVIETDGTIIIGHCRWEAAKKLGMDEVPCVVADELTEEEIRQLRIVDNKSNESDWDLELLASDLETIDMSGFDFDFGELEEMTLDENELDADDSDEEEERFVAKVTFDNYAHYHMVEKEFKAFAEEHGMTISVAN